MKFSEKNTLIKIFIIIGDTLQIFWEFFMLAIFGLLSYQALGGGETFDRLTFSFKIQNIFWFITVTLIFIVFAFLPYGLSKCLYWWYYEERKISERWIIPSKIISIITILIYIIGSISDFINI